MPRHILDKPRSRDGITRTDRYLRLDRQQGPHDNSKSLQKRPKPVGNGRLKQFLRIDRGIEA